VRLTTWNINSIRAREDRFRAWLDAARPDALCLQETKAQDKEFPQHFFSEAGYEVAFFGQKTYNGVAIASRVGLADVVKGLPGLPGDEDARGIAATVGGLRVVNVYVVNGKAVGDPKYAHKLAWMDALVDAVRVELGRGLPTVVCGDFNLCPTDDDTWDPAAWAGQIFCTDAERARFQALLGLGLRDAFRERHPDAWGRYAHTWWDYRGGGFPRGHGLRIDHHLVTPDLLARTEAVEIDREARKGDKASDHAPVTLVLSG
jgi:exodeoxyribonuclease-3